jgi:hypothetical protein
VDVSGSVSYKTDGNGQRRVLFNGKMRGGAKRSVCQVKAYKRGRITRGRKWGKNGVEREEEMEGVRDWVWGPFYPLLLRKVP